MKTVLCYGDSNTWGHNPSTLERFPIDVRWPGVLRRELGEGYHIIEEGLPGRTTVWDDPLDPSLTGKAYLGPCLASHRPLDLVIIMLGTNDLKTRVRGVAAEIALGAGVLVEMVQRSMAGPNLSAPRVLLVAPPPLGEDNEAMYLSGFSGGIEQSKLLGKFYSQVAQLYGCHFLDAGSIISSSEVDGVHLDADAHGTLGRTVAARAREILASG